MNEPKAPDNLRDWESIHIFLFSNGQQYSPPRKYHLQIEDLRLWDATKKILGHSQFGSMHSKIELHTLDGKKIEGPLELRNSAAYVAVEPPDSFISAGYEKYLIKASRSWEKRQEKLKNLEDKDTDLVPGDNGMFFDLTTLDKVQGIVTLNTITENSAERNSYQFQNNYDKVPITNNNSITQDKLYITNKSIKAENTEMRKKNISSLSKCVNNDKTSFKKKNLPVVRNFKCKNNKQQSVSAKNSRLTNKPTVKKVDNKGSLNREMSIILNEFNKESVPNDKNKNVEKNKDLDTTDVDRIHTIVDNSKIPREPSRENLINNDIIPYSLITDKLLCQEAIPNFDRNLNIKLRIKLEDLPISSSENGMLAEKKTSLITLIKKEKASQVNIDVILSKEIFTFNKHCIVNEQNNGKEYISYDENEKSTLIDVACNTLTSKSNILNRLYQIGSNDILLMTNKITETSECCTCIQVEVQNYDKETQTSFNSIKTVINTINVNNQRTGYSNTDDTKLNKIDLNPFPKYENDFKDVLNTPFICSKTLTDEYVQTEWCNILLQAKCQEDGRYTFHLPSLSLLKQYNIYKTYFRFIISFSPI